MNILFPVLYLFQRYAARNMSVAKMSTHSFKMISQYHQSEKSFFVWHAHAMFGLYIF